MKLQDKTRGYNWLQENQSPSSIVKIKKVYYVLSSEANATNPRPNLREMA